MTPALRVELEIPGRAVPKARARQGRGGRWYTPAPSVDYEETVAWACKAQRVRFGNRPVWVQIVFGPDNTTVVVQSSERELDRPSPGDIDNLVKSVLDGMMRGGLIDDDRQVLELGVIIAGTSEARGLPRASCPYCAPDEACALHLG